MGNNDNDRLQIRTSATDRNAETVRGRCSSHRYKNSLIAVERIRRTSRERSSGRPATSRRAAVKGLTGVPGGRAGCEGVSRLDARGRKRRRMKRRHAEARRPSRPRAPHSPERAGPVGRRGIIAARKASNSETATLTKAARCERPLLEHRRGRGRRHQGREQGAAVRVRRAVRSVVQALVRRAAIGIQVHQKGGGDGLSVESFLNGTGDARNWLYSSPQGQEIRAPTRTRVEAARLRNAEAGRVGSAQHSRGDTFTSASGRKTNPAGRPHGHLPDGHAPPAPHRTPSSSGWLCSVARSDRGRSGTAASRSRPRGCCAILPRRAAARSRSDRVAHAPGRADPGSASPHGRWRRQRALG